MSFLKYICQRKLIQLTQNGIAVPHAVAEETGTAANVSNLGFNTLVLCPQDYNCCDCTAIPTSIALTNPGENVTGDFNIVVTKIC